MPPPFSISSFNFISNFTGSIWVLTYYTNTICKSWYKVLKHHYTEQTGGNEENQTPDQRFLKLRGQWKGSAPTPSTARAGQAHSPHWAWPMVLLQLPGLQYAQPDTRSNPPHGQTPHLTQICLHDHKTDTQDCVPGCVPRTHLLPSQICSLSLLSLERSDQTGPKLPRAVIRGLAESVIQTTYYWWPL